MTAQPILRAVDFETTGGDLFHSDLPFSFSIAGKGMNSYYHEWPVDPITRAVLWEKDDGYQQLKAVCEDRTITKVGHNIRKFDRRCASLLGIKMRGPIIDTYFAAHACNSAEETFKLKQLCDKYVGMGIADEEELKSAVVKITRLTTSEKWPERWTPKFTTTTKDDGTEKKERLVSCDYWMPETLWRLFPREARRLGIDRNLCRTYCIKDSHRVLKLWAMYDHLLDELGVRHIFEEENDRLSDVVYDMETRGVRVSRKLCKSGLAECDAKAKQLDETITEFAGPEFNFNSPKQKIALFVGKLKLTPLTMTKGGKKSKPQPQVDKRFFDHHRNHHPLCAAVADRSRVKTARTFYRTYLRLMVREGAYWVIHPSYRQIGADTGRFSCADPNLQNVPKRGPNGDLLLGVRGPFGPRPGYVWLHFDYKGQEARIWADEANDPVMLELFRQDEDPYVYLVKEIKRVTGIDVAELYPDDPDPAKMARQTCKNNFLGKLYGEAAKTMALAFNTTPENGLRIVQAMSSTFPRIEPYMKEMKAVARRDGGIRNRYGQLVKIRLMLSPYTGRPELLVHKAVNYVIQSDAARMMKRSMIRITRWLHECQKMRLLTGCGLVMQVHDELVIEVRKSDYGNKPWIARKIAEIMSDNPQFKRVATPVDGKVTLRYWNRQIPLEL